MPTLFADEVVVRSVFTLPQPPVLRWLHAARRRSGSNWESSGTLILRLGDHVIFRLPQRVATRPARPSGAMA